MKNKCSAIILGAGKELSDQLYQLETPPISLFQRLNQRDLFKLIQLNQSNIFSLVPQMINPERSKNNIVDATYDDIKSILNLFFNKY